MAIDPQIFIRLMVGTFVLIFVGFVIRGTTTIVLGSSTAETISAPVFLLAILCAVAGFVLGVTVKLQEVLSNGETTA